MPKRLFEYFYWQNRNNKISAKNAIYIGNQLIRGATLPEALKKISQDIESIKQKNAFRMAFSYINEGDDIAKSLFRSKVNLRGRDKYVLAQNFTNEQKGKIIKSWSESKIHISNTLNYVILCLFLVNFCIITIPTFPFVVPQFREIIGNSDYNIKNSLLKTVFSLSDSGLLFLFFIFLIISLIIIAVLGFLLSNTKKIQEESDFLAVLSTLDNNNQLEVIETLLNPICFPTLHKKLLSMVNALKAGENLDSVLSKSNLSNYSKWLLNLSMFDKDRTALKEGSVILNEKIMLSSISSMKFIEVMVVIMQSIAFLFVAYFIFGSLNTILLGNMP